MRKINYLTLVIYALLFIAIISTVGENMNFTECPPTAFCEGVSLNLFVMFTTACLIIGFLVWYALKQQVI